LAKQGAGMHADAQNGSESQRPSLQIARLESISERNCYRKNKKQSRKQGTRHRTLIAASGDGPAQRAQTQGGHSDGPLRERRPGSASNGRTNLQCPPAYHAVRGGRAMGGTEAVTSQKHQQSESVFGFLENRDTNALAGHPAPPETRISSAFRRHTPGVRDGGFQKLSLVIDRPMLFHAILAQPHESEA